MPQSSPPRLPRGRHALSRAEVDRVHRGRLLAAMAEAMTEKGYAGTSVEDVLRRARVSRQSFYRLFSSKLDCFMAAFDQAGELVRERLAQAAQGGADPVDRFDRAITAYLDALASEPGYARLFLVEVFAAGPEAVARRSAVQRDLASALADLMGATGESARFACQVVVAAIGTMVTPAVASGDMAALRAVGPPIVDHVRTLIRSGVLEG
ncbi:TetR/AcrR family transcriptional regulator [Actinomadura opuntiae]|uniref:TetR/AcrR family transcriptional regulator n=1 Tax=Actinomadura sp. OS1-43 TaxID=604315 RepID=UPI00255AB978|nr:TetR/AcrR family transcriptional regulator [Actinomadura sp. OS1-43]MDL4818198.1 TetR/AcrR family transcriptional regulator [Actinomadura sp. OS1-43]